MSDEIEQIAVHRIVPVVVIDDAGSAAALGDALLAGGLPVAEVTLRTAAAVDAIAAMARTADLLVGAGTVITPAQVDDAVEAGARFIVSPGMSTRVVRRCAELGVPVVPGVATATELMAAHDEGVRVVKFFPAETSGGVPALRALAAPFPQMRFVPTGGVTPANAGSYLRLPSVLAIGGSWMVPADAVDRGDFAAVTTLARDAVALAQGG